MTDHDSGPKRLGGLPEIIPPDQAQAVGAAGQAPGEALANADPRAMNRRLESRVRTLCGGQFIARVSSRFEGEVFSHSVVEGVDWDLPVENREKVRELVTRLTRPAPEARIMDALYRLRMFTIGRGEGNDEGRAAEATVWVQALRKYPADVVVHTLGEWTTRINGRFWPTWHELEQHLKAQASLRTVIAAKLEREP